MSQSKASSLSIFPLYLKIRACNRAADPQEQSLTVFEKQLQQTIYLVEHQQMGLESAKQSLAVFEKQHQQTIYLVEHQQMGLESAKQSLTVFGERLNQTKYLVEHQQMGLESVKQSLTVFVEQLNQTKCLVEHQQMGLESAKQSLAEMDAFYRVSLKKAGLAEMEEFYKEKLQQESSARQQAEEELKAFKDRVAGEVGLSLKTGNSESMNDPVNESRLKEMYEDLWKQWPKIKSYLRSVYKNPVFAKAEIQKQFQDAAKEMEKKKRLIEMVFDLTDSSSQKVIEYTKLSIQNLQLAVYHSRKEDAAAQEGETRDAVVMNFFSKCLWLGCLLALNNPPLQPDWENHHPGMDPWNFFPQNFRAASTM